MNTKIKLMNYLVIVVIVIFFTGCNNDPKGSNDDDSDGYTKIIKEITEKHSSSNKMNPVVNKKMHQVKVKEILAATKYLYLLVQENNEEFWIAVRKQDIQIGETYFYNGGLLKTNFKSNEHDKVFDKIYLVTSLVKSNHGDHVDKKKLELEGSKIVKNNKTPEVKGSVKISELVNNQKKYEGKTIQISGRCSKTNPNIMGRNWIHIKDGSMDNYDLVITSDHFVKEGSMVTIKAKVTLNKDFGAGYSYKLILEDGIIIQ